MNTPEPRITINGSLLTNAQAMTVRVALGSFAMSLESGLGDDEHGRAMTAGYKARLNEIYGFMSVVLPGSPQNYWYESSANGEVK
jgi:hypothetical protein